MTDREYEQWIASLVIVGEQAYMPDDPYDMRDLTHVRQHAQRQKNRPSYVEWRRKYMREYKRRKRAA